MTALRILIVDDQALNLKLLRAQLEGEGHLVLSAPNGLVALEILRRDAVDVVISDILMPVMDGYRLCHAVRSDERLRHLPFIVYTASYVFPSDEKLSLELGADRYLRKPASIAELARAIAEAMASARREPTQTVDTTEVLEAYRSRLVEKLEQKNIELTEAVNRLRLQSTALETAADSILITDPEGVILWVNSAFTTNTGFRAEEAVGQTPRILRSGRHDQDFYRRFWETIRSGETWQSEFENRRKDGTITIDEHTVTPVRGPDGTITHYVGVMHDITDRKRAEEELRDAHSRLRQLLEHSPAVIYALRIDGENVTPYLVSENITRLLGFQVDETLHPEWWLEHLHPEDRASAEAALAETLAGETVSTEFRMRHRDGSYLWIENHQRLVRDQNGLSMRIVGVWTDITERRRVQAELAESEHRFREMLDNLELVSIMLDPAAGITYCNDYLLRLTGWEREDVIGRNWFEVFLPTQVQEELSAVFSDLISDSPVVRHHENEIVTRSGEKRLIRWNNSVLRSAAGEITGMASIGEDITERVAAEKHLQESEERYRLLFDRNPHPTWVYDTDTLRFLAVNESAVRHYGYSREEFLAMTIADIREPEGVDDLMRALHQGESDVPRIYGVFQHRKKDGTLIDVEIASSAITFAGRSAGLVLANDVTERLQLEQQLLRAQRMESLGTLAGGIAHDLNNILMPILMGASMLKRLSPDPRAQDAIENIERSVNRGKKLVNQVLLFARGQAAARANVDLREIVADVAAMARSTFPRNLDLSVEFHDAAGHVIGDPTQLHQVLLNLCVNARDAMPDGGHITITASNRDFDAQQANAQQGSRAGSYVVLEVADTGTGMESAVRDRIFEPFFTTKTLGKGTGLGLSVVQGIVRGHNGFVEVSSEIGRGTTFRVYLPRAVELETATDEDSDAAEMPQGEGRTILVVDDEQAILSITSQTLEAFGYRVLVAHDGAQALAIYERERLRIGAVVTDLMMPGIGGAELIQAIRGIDPTARIIAASGVADHASAAAAASAGAIDFLAKPFTPDVLLRALARVLHDPVPS